MNTLLWYHPLRWDAAIHCSAKAGSQTLLKAILTEYNIPDPGFGQRRALVHHELVATGRVEATTRPETYNAYQFVRSPKDRFESLWRWGCRDKNQGIPSELWLCDPDELLWYISDHLYDNVHWCPQFVATPMATAAMPLESIGEYIPTYEEIINTTAPGDIPEYDQDFLYQLYSMDQILWQISKENK